ncbi:hypothetical protein EVAR_86401_1 [Eumeta japonica]|uniref:Uncharacterized protein n=1 Tax=Eumeta variegata TaxID=151549 RepID=A0A4C1WAE2_EUMVA|nr:hypothetical protein EVAR_86401_1 [Eumeta japonica]
MEKQIRGSAANAPSINCRGTGASISSEFCLMVPDRAHTTYRRHYSKRLMIAFALLGHRLSVGSTIRDLFVLEQGYVIPEEAEQFLNLNNDRLYSRDSSASPSVSSGKRFSNALSSNEPSEQPDAHSDDTVKGSEDESVASHTKMVYKKKRNQKRRAVHRHSNERSNTTDSIQMEID